MSSEHRLAAGLYGKHPDFGDFIAAGLSDAALGPLGDWLQAALGEWRSGVGDGWQDLFDHAPRLFFWIGPALIGGQPLRGVWTASHDRTGRRFPLIIAQEAGPTPIDDPDPDFYAQAAQALTRLRDARDPNPRDHAENLYRDLPIPAGTGGDQARWPTFWALNASLDPADLLQQLQSADHAHASTVRSYWWFDAAADVGRPSGVLACHGWPDPAELHWLIVGGQEGDGGFNTKASS